MFQQLNWDIQITVTINLITICCIMPRHFATLAQLFHEDYKEWFRKIFEEKV